MPESIYYEHKDEIVNILLAGGQASALVCSGAGLVKEAAKINKASKVATVALGRLMMGTLMLGITMKKPTDSVTVNINGKGPIGTLIAVSSPGKVKAMVRNPGIKMPGNSKGQISIGDAVGKDGLITVIKDMGMKEPYVGQVKLTSGEIAEDFAMYFTVSEQKPSLVSLGVSMSENNVLQAGGVLIQPLPGCIEEVISQIELRSALFASISQELSYMTLDDLIKNWFRGLEPLILDRTPIRWECDCSEERMEKALISLGKSELLQMIEQDKGAEVVCHFCGKKHYFTEEELKDFLKRAQASRRDKK